MKTIYLLLLLLFAHHLFAQTIIRGRVLAKEGPIAGANVFLVDTFDGASSDSAGHFRFETEETGAQLLEIRFIGYAEIVLPITLNQAILEVGNITLKEAYQELNAVVITAGAFEASDEGKAVVMNSLDIATTAGATGDIAGALQTLPGAQRVGESGRLFVRGGEGYETRSFIDGMWVQNEFGAGVPNVPTRMRFSPFLFKGTLFSTGAYSAEYGQALSSVLALQTIDFPTESRFDLSLMSVGVALSGEQLWPEKGSVYGKVNYFDLTPYQAIVPQLLRFEKAPRTWQAESLLRWKTGKNGMLKAMLQGSGSSLSLFQPDPNAGNAERKVSLDNGYLHANITHKGLLLEKWVIQSGLSFTTNSDDTRTSGGDIRTDESGLHAKVTVRREWGNGLDMLIGTEYFGMGLGRSLLRNSQTIMREMGHSVWAGFNEWQWHLGNRLAVRTGLRAEHSSAGGHSNIAPRFSTAYKTGEKHQISLAWGEFYQLPQPQWLIWAPQLRPEKAAHWVANFQYMTAQRTFRIEAYHKNYDRLVKFAPTDSFAAQSYTNSGQGFANGLDVFYRDRQLIENGDFSLSYSFVDTRRDYLDFPISTTPHFAARHNASAVFKYTLVKWRMIPGMTLAYTSGRPYHDPNRAGFMQGRTPAFFDLSANLSWLPKQHLIVYLSATNLTGRNNVFGYQYAQAPNAEGVFSRQPIGQTAPRFLFIGIFITFSRNKAINQLESID